MSSDACLSCFGALCAPHRPPLRAEGSPLPGRAQIGPAPVLPRRQDERTGHWKEKLQQCTGPFPQEATSSIGHRGAALMFPSTGKEAYMASRAMGRRHHRMRRDIYKRPPSWVCRHSQCDLHTTTNILAVPALASKCTQGFSPADPATGQEGFRQNAATQRHYAREFKQLTRQDGRRHTRRHQPSPITMNGTPRWRTDLYRQFRPR